MRGIYKITNNINGKFYVGMAEDVHKRWEQHLAYARKTKKRMYIHKSMSKYGCENFSFSILEECGADVDLTERERHWISQLNPIYNTTRGGTGGDTFSGRTEDQRNKTRAKISEITKNLWKDPVYREKVSSRIKEAANNKRDVWSNCKKGSKSSTWLGYLEMIDPQGKSFHIFETTLECSKITGIGKVVIRKHAVNSTAMKRGKYKNFTFRYHKQKPETSNEKA